GPDVLAPRLWVYVVAAIEVIRPGVILGFVARLTQWKPSPGGASEGGRIEKAAAPVSTPAAALDSGAASAEHPTSAPPAPLKPGPRPIVSAMVLTILGLFFCGVIWLRLQQGFLTPESARAGLRFLLRYAVPPFFIFPFLWKWVGKSR